MSEEAEDPALASAPLPPPAQAQDPPAPSLQPAPSTLDPKPSALREAPPLVDKVVVLLKATGDAPILKQNKFKITASDRFEKVVLSPGTSGRGEEP